MTNFVASHAVAISIGNAVENLPALVNPIQDAAGAGALMIRRAPNLRITNTHATQTLHYARNGVASATVGTIIDAGQSAIVPAPFPDDSPSIFASGATTTGILEVGAVTP